MRGLMHSIQRDMVLLENQLPVFVLDRLLELQPGTQNETGLVAQLAVLFFDPLIPKDEWLTRTDKLPQTYEADPFTNMEELHCLDIFHRSLLLPKLDSRRGLKSRSRWNRGSRVVDKRQQQMIHRVTELSEAGTKSLFLNLIAFEQCHMDSSNDITSYIVFVDNLIDSAEDVSYLRSCGVLEHWLENDSIVADMFNQLGQGIIFNIKDSYPLSVDPNVYYHQHNKYYRKWNAWKKTLKEKYFDSP
ncbi:unnamed protein product [Arabis nemorensis]|uniref:Uncharacterized protein n=1 Tax=Arabis nemorensis TaxID=586526 RepID=A0A565C9T6_9BRAS|nr:unnamed protein product [Arabis nemorensis]